MVKEVDKAGKDSPKKLDLSSVLKEINKELKGSDLEGRVSTGATLKKYTDKDFIRLGEWWTKPTGLHGIPLGAITLIAGPGDTGKTSLALQTMLAAQKQGFGICYVETENKTTEDDLLSWGIDVDSIILIKSTVAEVAYKLTFLAIEQFKKANPTVPLLLVIDSLGNLLSQRDSEIDLVDDNQKPGGKGQSNRLGLSKIIIACEKHKDLACLLISYTYTSMGYGPPTSVIAGGKSLGLFSSLIYTTSRKAWYTKTVSGQKVRVGADVKFSLVKNHVSKSAPGLPVIDWRISKDGIQFLGDGPVSAIEDTEVEVGEV